MNRLILFTSGLFASIPLQSVAAETEVFTVIAGGNSVGYLSAEIDGDKIAIDYDYKNNGRGPTIQERITLGPDALPTKWEVSGRASFGGRVNEHFSMKRGTASWIDSTGRTSRTIQEPSLYIGQSASPWALGIYARALLNDSDQKMPGLPGGILRLEKGETIGVTGDGGHLEVTAYALFGIALNPSYFLLDKEGRFFASMGRSVIVRKGYEGEDSRLRALALKMSTARYAEIQRTTAHKYNVPIRIRNVRLFDPKTQTLTERKSVLIFRESIAAIESIDSPSTPGEVTIDGAGGTLVPGMMEMHGHVSEDSAILNLAAGVTTVRDMGNNNADLLAMIDRIESGQSAGSRIVPSGLIEGRSPFSFNAGVIADSEQQAVDAVRWYAARGYWQIKIYNSINPDWVPAMVAEAHHLGLRVSGHVPAFSTADAMLATGYDEITHINQLMLGWILQPGEDTRNILRLTALRRLPELDLNSAKVQRTIRAMVDRKIAIDPTLVIHEASTLSRDGEMPPGMADYLDHMPIDEQRNAKKAWVDLSVPGDDVAYRGAFEKIVETLKILNDLGVLIVPGTDMGGGFSYHRELELYQKFGMTPAQILKRATWDMATYMGQGHRLGSIEKGKLADVFLVQGDPTQDLKTIKAISMVVKGGTVYFPSEIYGHFGITPFAGPPTVTVP